MPRRNQKISRRISQKRRTRRRGGLISNLGFFSRKPLVLALLIVFAVVGIYMLLQSRAETGSIASRTLGNYPGAHDGNLVTYKEDENWLGRSVTKASLNFGQGRNGEEAQSNAWSYFERQSSAGPNWSTRQDITMAITVPLIFYDPNNPSGDNWDDYTPPNKVSNRIAELDRVANGKNDGVYRYLAQKFVQGGHGDDVVRLGHEADCTCYPWAFRDGAHNAYQRAWLHVRQVMKSVAPNLKFDFQGNGGWLDRNSHTGTTMAESMPEVLRAADIIGVDVYDVEDWSGVKAKLDYTRDLAARYGKQMSIPEWGLWATFGEYANSGGHNDNPQFIQNMYNWINTTPASGPGSVAYHTYFWHHPPHHLDLFPNGKQCFLELFGNRGADSPFCNANSTTVDNPPTINITSPANDATISPGTLVNVTVNASDDKGIRQVDFLVDGALKSSDTTSPYSYGWSTTGLSGNHTIQVKAVDTSGKSATDSVNVTISPPPPPTDNLPTVSITNPANGATLQPGVVITVKASASDDRSTPRVAFIIDGREVDVDSNIPYETNWSTAGLSGQHTIQAKATDSAGQISTATITVTIGNEPAPELVLSGVSDGQRVRGLITVQAIPRSDIKGITRVEFYIDGVKYRTEEASPYCLESNEGSEPCNAFDTHKLSVGKHTIRAVMSYENGAKTASTSATINVRNGRYK